jgi:hypothetical protein
MNILEKLNNFLNSENPEIINLTVLSLRNIIANTNDKYIQSLIKMNLFDDIYNLFYKFFNTEYEDIIKQIMNFLCNCCLIGNYEDILLICPKYIFINFLKVFKVFNCSLIFYFVKLICIIIEKENLYFKFFQDENPLIILNINSFKNCFKQAQGVLMFNNLKDLYNNETLNNEIDDIIKIID